MRVVFEPELDVSGAVHVLDLDEAKKEVSNLFGHVKEDVRILDMDGNVLSVSRYVEGKVDDESRPIYEGEEGYHTEWEDA